MGTFRFGIPTVFALNLKKQFGLNTFVETGTFKGNTAAWGATNFSKVFSIEAYPLLFERASQRFAAESHVEIILGNSKDELPKVVEKLDSPALFWLDAHWSGQGTAGEGAECPLLEELETIARSPFDNIILVDDARLFLAPPPPPHNPQDWPDYEAIIKSVRRTSPDAYVSVFDDIIAVVPGKYRVAFIDLVREREVFQASSSPRTRPSLLGRLLGGLK